MSISAHPRKVALLVAVLVVMTMGPVPPVLGDQGGWCIGDASGDLLEEIRSISQQLPGPGSEGMVVPSVAQMATWVQIVDAIEQGDLRAACGLLADSAFPYRIIRYTDEGYGSKPYLMLKEQTPVTVGWGTYAVNPAPDAANIVLEVPHPRSEWLTEEEGVGLFRQVNAKALLIAGTRRCANSSYAGCGGTTSFCGREEPFRSSDVAHTTQTMFQAAHQALVAPGTAAVAVQIHGCSAADCPDLFVSNTTCTPGALTTRLYRRAAAYCSGFAVDLADCGPQECGLVGRTNVQGRYSNGVFYASDFQACTAYPPGPSQPEQFLHLEQSMRFRESFDCLAKALSTLLTEPHERYLPVVSTRAALLDPVVLGPAGPAIR